VHAVAALATVGGFIVHIYMGVFVVPGGMHAIVRGDVSEGWAKAHHALWLRTLPPADAAAPGDPPASGRS
jgi:formate dehydrogenase subunit gamma